MSDLTLITGAKGMIGSAIARQLDAKSRKIELSHSQLDLTDLKATRDYFDKIQPDRVFHCAGKVGGLFLNQKHPATLHRENLLMNLSVLEASQLGKKKAKLLGFLSSCIFPEKAVYPLQSNALHDGAPHPSNYGYAYAKRMFDIQAQAYQEEYNASVILMIPTNVYGPNDNYSLSDSHVVAGLIHRMFLAKKDNKDLTIFGSGKPLREFVFSDDIARFCIWSMDHYDGKKPLFISHGRETSIQELAEIMAKVMKFEKKLIFDPSKPDGQFRKPTDAESLRSLHPQFNFTSLEEGLGITIERFKENYPNVRQ